MALPTRAGILRLTTYAVLIATAAATMAQVPIGDPPGDPRGETANGLGYAASDGNEVLLWKAAISGSGITAKNQRVSGTNVELTVQVGICLAIPPMDPQGSALLNDPDHPTLISNYQVEIQSPMGSWETVDTQAGPFRLHPKETPSPMPSTGLRIATTAWEHGTTIKVKVSYDVSYYMLVNGNRVGPVTPQRFEHDFPFTAHNVMHVAATTSGEHCQTPPQGEDILWLEYRSDFENVAGNLAGHCYGAAAPLKHATRPGSAAAAVSQQAPAIIANIRESTVAILNLHGHNNQVIGGWPYDFLADTDGWSLPDWNTPRHVSAAANSITTTQISAQVTGKPSGGYPAYNLVYLYSCHTIDTWGRTVSSTGFPTAYGIAATPATVGKAYLGYTTSIDINCWTKADWDAATAASVLDPFKLDPRLPRTKRVCDHAEEFLNQIAAGKNVRDALTTADSSIPMVYSTGQGYDYQRNWYRVATLVVGDDNTRLRFVYLSDQERQTLPGESGNRIWVKLPVGQ